MVRTVRFLWSDPYTRPWQATPTRGLGDGPHDPSPKPPRASGTSPEATHTRDLAGAADVELPLTSRTKPTRTDAERPLRRKPKR
jgi:hypothetical protein